MSIRVKWKPHDYEKLYAYERFFVDSEAIYKSGDIDADWQKFIDDLCFIIKQKDPNLETVCDLVNGRFTLVRNSQIAYLTEDIDSYVVVFIIIPKEYKYPGLAKQAFKKHKQILYDCLMKLYPEHVNH